MEYPILVKSTNDYLMYKYRVTGALEIVDMNSNFKQIYMGYGKQEAVRLFRKQLKEQKGQSC
jgi:hypothetical protein